MWIIEKRLEIPLLECMIPDVKNRKPYIYTAAIFTVK
jgi:hypothetical protein